MREFSLEPEFRLIIPFFSCVSVTFSMGDLAPCLVSSVRGMLNTVP